MSPKRTEETHNEEEMKQIANSMRSTPPPKGDRLPCVLHLCRPDVHLAVEAKWRRMLIDFTHKEDQRRPDVEDNDVVENALLEPRTCHS